MALTLEDLHKKKSESTLRNAVEAACWKHAKTILQLPTPSIQQMNQAKSLLSGSELDKYVIAVAVVIDDGTVDDAAIEAAVAVAANKLLALFPIT